MKQNSFNLTPDKLAYIWWWFKSLPSYSCSANSQPHSVSALPSSLQQPELKVRVFSFLSLVAFCLFTGLCSVLAINATEPSTDSSLPQFSGSLFCQPSAASSLNVFSPGLFANSQPYHWLSSISVPAVVTSYVITVSRLILYSADLALANQTFPSFPVCASLLMHLCPIPCRSGLLPQ